MEEESEEQPKRRSWLRFGCLGLFAFLVAVMAIAERSIDPSILAQQPSQLTSESKSLPRARVAVALAEQIDEIRAVMQGCDQSWMRMTSLGEAGLGRTESYRVAATAERVCDDSWMKLRSIEKRSDSGPLGDLVELCQIKVNERRIAAKSVAAMIDGDLRPSMVEKSRLDVADAERAAAACNAALG